MKYYSGGLYYLRLSRTLLGQLCTVFFVKTSGRRGGGHHLKALGDAIVLTAGRGGGYLASRV